MARPRKQIDHELLRSLAGIGCTVDEIATMLKCSKDTLERRFAADIEKGREEGRASLRRKQWTTAMGDGKSAATMQIWLGKQLLGQKDRIETETRDATFEDLMREAAKEQPHE
jgi:hypothetical protein